MSRDFPIGEVDLFCAVAGGETRPVRGRRTGLCALWVMLLLTGCAKASTSSSTSVGKPTAKTFNGLAQVGALFAGPVGGGVHFCTASVVHSPRHNLLVTAAHCLFGTASNLVFVPSYHNGISPFGSWNIQAAYVSSRWLANQDPRADFAFLTAAPHERSGQEVNVEDAVGADRLLASYGFGVPVTVVGYPMAMGGKPITCANDTYDHDGYPTFDCNGFVDGTSGSPWITHFDSHSGLGELYGVIGGLHQGGCTPQISYSSYFGPDTMALYQRAMRAGPGDDVPVAGSSGC